MPFLTADDGVRIHYAIEGDGPALVFAHEYGGDARSWDAQVEHFSKRFRCVTYDARGYAPSDVPDDPGRYSLERARQDLLNLLDGLSIETANLVGLSMGSFTVLHVAVAAPERVSAVVVAGTGYGSHPRVTETFRADMRANAALIRERGMKAFANAWGRGPTRIQLEQKNPRLFADHLEALAGHAAVGAAHTMAEIQGKRPSLYALERELRTLTVPTLILAGDEDEPSIEASLMLRREIPSSGLEILARTGHLMNLEEPERFNALVERFLDDASAGRWAR